MNEMKTELVKSMSNISETDIEPKGDLSNRLFVQQKLYKRDATQSIFTGSFFRETEILNCNFSRCDFEGNNFEVVKFDNILFHAADVRSCKFVNSQFHQCDFTDAFIKNCLFINCEFIDCNFGGSAFTESEIVNSKLCNCIFQKSTNMLNKFVQCSFCDLRFGDCTFLLHIFDQCEFKDVAFNSDSIGLLYGISVHDLKNCDLLFLGNKQPSIKNIDDIDTLIIDEYEDRKWKLHSAVTKLSFGHYTPLRFITDITEYLSDKVNSNSIIIVDDTTFINNIFEYLLDKGRLPFFGLKYFLDNFGRSIKKLTKKESINFPTGNALLNSSYLHFLKIQSQSHAFLSFPKDVNLSQPIVIKLKMRVPPTRNICTLLDTAAFSLTNTKINSKILKTANGSIIYWIGTTVAAVFGFKLILFGLNGCMIQLTELFSRVKILYSGKTQEYQSMALTPEQRIPEDIAIMNPLYMNLLNNDVLKSHDLGGLAKDNIISIETAKAFKKDKG